MKRTISTIILMTGMAASALQAENTGLIACQTDTLADYQNMQGQCSVGILDFSAFTFNSSGTGGATLEMAGDIMITPLADPHGTGGGFSIGLENPNNLLIPPAFTVGVGQSATYLLGWHFVIDPGPVSSGADLGVDPPVGDINITQQYCLDSQFAIGVSHVFCSNGTGNAPPLQTLSVTVQSPTAHIDFNPPAQFFGNVRTIISLNGDNQNGVSGFDGSTGTATVVSPTPEPISLTLAFAGLMGIAAYRKLKLPD